MSIWIIAGKLALCSLIVSVRPYRYYVFADFILEILEQFLLFLKIFLQKYID